MQKESKKTLKIFAGILAFALIVTILFVTNIIVGNPISAKIADKAINKYVAQKYTDLNLEIEKSSYNFKHFSYMAIARSTISLDTKFKIYYQNGKGCWDTYEAVLGMDNTLNRLSIEYSSLVKKIIAKELGYKDNKTMVEYDNERAALGRVNENLKLDMKFDRKLPINAKVNLNLNLKNQSLVGVSRFLSDAHTAFKDNYCDFYEYSIISEDSDGTVIMVSGVTPAHIESGNLLSLLEKAEKNGNTIEEGIRVHIWAPAD